MTRAIFIAGNECALTRAVEAETGNRVDQYAVALIPNRLSARSQNTIGKPEPSNPQNENQKRQLLDWNPSSPVSARTLVLAAENRLERIDEAILICSPPSIRSSAADIPLSDIEIMINDHIKGWFYLVKELASVFSNRKQQNGASGRSGVSENTVPGALVLVYPDIPSGKDDAADVLGPAALASFRALTAGLLASSHNEKYTTVAFSTSDAGKEAAFASFLFKNIDELSKRSNGKLFKFGKFKLF